MYLIKNLNKLGQSLLRINQFSLYELTNYNQLIRNYSDFKKFDKGFIIEFSDIDHKKYTNAFGIPKLRNKIFVDLYLAFRMSSLDSNFKKEQFLNECKEATLVFCNLIADKKLEECEQLMTKYAYEELINSYGNKLEEEKFQRLRINQDDIHYQNLILLRDFKKEGRIYVEATCTILKKVYFETLNFGKFSQNLIKFMQIFENSKGEDEIKNTKIPQHPLFSDLIITRYLRDYTDGKDSNTDWLISYFDHKFISHSKISETFQKLNL